jgi:hypothetical protein
MTRHTTAYAVLGLSFALAAPLLGACGGGEATIEDAGSGPSPDVDGGKGPDGTTIGNGHEDGGKPPTTEDGGKPPTDDGSTPDDTGTPSTACGTCPTGFTCDAASTLCKSAGGIPHFGQVYVILMENQGQASIEKSASAPYINSLLAAHARTKTYNAVTHPSLPNYIALTSGDTQGIACDCHPGTVGSACSGLSCSLVASNCDCNKPVQHLGDQLEAASLKWRIYGEGMGTACNTKDTGKYAPKHIPFLYYDNVRTDAARCAAHVVDFTQLAGDLGKYAFSFITPDMCNDMHDSCAPTSNQIKQGDDWLKANVPTITSAPGFADNGILFVVWDEAGYLEANTVGLIAISPKFAKAPSSTSTSFDHYSLLATIEEGLGLPKIGKAASAHVMVDLFK